MTDLFERSQKCICEWTPSLDFFLFVHGGEPGRLCHQGEPENCKDCPKTKTRALEPLLVQRALEIIALGTFLGARQVLAGAHVRQQTHPALPLLLFCAVVTVTCLLLMGSWGLGLLRGVMQIVLPFLLVS